MMIILKYALAIAVSTVFAFAPAYAAPPEKPFGIPVKAVTVKIGPVRDELTAVGTLLANESVMIRPEIAGRIARIYFNEGQAVTAGTKLLTIEPAEYQARAAESAAQVKLAQRRKDRAEELFKQHFISEQILNEAQEALASAIARNTQDKVQLAKTEIHAPFNGTLGLRQVSPGAYVQPGQDIVKLGNVDSIKLDFRIPESNLAKIKKNHPVSIEVDAYPNRKFSGEVYAIESGIDVQTRTAMLRARIPNNDRELISGLFARVKIVMAARDRSLLVPEQAIVPRGEDVFVFRVHDGKAQLTKVQTGQRAAGDVEIISGLNEKDMVVTDGQMKLQDGAPVTVMSAVPPK